ncbi:hypothetical protein FA10DRAFT_277409 [Acaromyces ingoldii]|uniref:Arabinosidase n=1 Tax=Acaromyces ingoldii TaxID=215250 RepID=A0A316YY18_9BASI|nr:hypothetical protein FA10DRAFT_277409 [Acaromyces ingoldii]PWN93644.1 hypothetical protein FA10DRAFT_277409 [Acaromyces ingoldii]
MLHFLSHSLVATAALLATAALAATTARPASRAEDAKAGYLLTTFPVQDEAVYMRLSNGNDAHSWRALSLNGRQDILRSDISTEGVRDTFVVPSQDGSQFWLTGTDLNVNAHEGDFNASTRFGSRSMLLWTSPDLVNWKGPSLTPALVNASAGNVWAPEAYYDPLVKAYVVVFASRFWSDKDKDRTGPVPNNVLMYVTTQDFKSFSPAKTYFNPGYPVIDATFLPMPEEGANVWYRWVKSEVDFKVFQQRSTNGILGKWTNVGGAPDSTRIEFASQYSNNEGPLIFRDNVDRRKFHLWIDENTLNTYIPATATTLNDMAAWKADSRDGFPQHIKHGKVLAVNQRQYDAILAKYQVVNGA